MLTAHTLPFFTQPAVDFRLLKEPRAMHICPDINAAADAELDPQRPPAVIVTLMHSWLEELRRADLGFAQRNNGVVVRRALIVGLHTVFVEDDDDDDDEEAAEVGSKRKPPRSWEKTEGHQLLLLCDLPPASSAAQAAANTLVRPFARIKLTIVDNLSEHHYQGPVHQWIAYAFTQAQLAVWPCCIDATNAAGACQCEFVRSALFMSRRLSTLCMGTSFRAVLIASLMRDPAAKLRQPEPRHEGRRFATLIALHLRRMRRFLLTDTERIWNPTQPHAVFADGNLNGRLSAEDWDMKPHCMPLASPYTLWAVPLRDVPRGVGAADIRRWVFEQSGLPVYPIYFEPALSRPLGLTYYYLLQLRRAAATCNTSARMLPLMLAQF
jgi:hypothetical protein